MENLIRRSDAIKAIKALECFGYIECKTKALVKDINAIPSADRPQGEWKINNNGWAYCSKCGRLGLESYDFCPYCGARMFAKDTNVPNKKGADE